MSILNSLVDYSGGVEARFEVECELLTLHFLDVVEVFVLSNRFTRILTPYCRDYESKEVSC